MGVRAVSGIFGQKLCNRISAVHTPRCGKQIPPPSQGGSRGTMVCVWGGGGGYGTRFTCLLTEQLWKNPKPHGILLSSPKFF